MMLPCRLANRQGSCVMLMRRAIVLWPLAGAVLVGLLFFPVRTLEVRSLPTGRVVYREPAATGDRFTFAYIHSIENIPVEGVFAVEDDGALRVVETRFASFGAGLPTQAAGRSDDGKWLVAPGGQKLPEFSFYISRVNRSCLRIGDKTLDLNRLMEPGEIVAVAVRRYPYLLVRPWLEE
jgi:hypothetical protein